MRAHSHKGHRTWASGVLLAADEAPASTAATTASHQTAPAVALATIRTHSLDGHLAYLLKGQLEKLPSRRGTFHVLVDPDLRGNSICLLRVDYAVGIIFGPQIPLQAEHSQGQRAFRQERRADFFDPLLTGLWLAEQDMSESRGGGREPWPRTTRWRLMRLRRWLIS